jgi:hypothetical protein
VTKKTLKFGRGFKVILGNARVQAAQMVIEPGGSEGGPGNRHRGSDQWLLNRLSAHADKHMAEACLIFQIGRAHV